jgi:hypothetical protein
VRKVRGGARAEDDFGNALLATGRIRVMRPFRTVIALAAVAASVGGTVLVATPATAGTVTVNYSCFGPGIAQSRTMLMEITAPATAGRGSTISLGASITDTRNFEQEFTPGQYRGILAIEVGGASSGTVETTGLATPAIARGEPFRLVGGQAQVPAPTLGDVTFRPATWWLVNNTGVRFYRCVVRSGETAAVAASTRVVA